MNVFALLVMMIKSLTLIRLADWTAKIPCMDARNRVHCIQIPLFHATSFALQNGPCPTTDMARESSLLNIFDAAARCHFRRRATERMAANSFINAWGDCEC
jgi:hypothetical protein